MNSYEFQFLLLLHYGNFSYKYHISTLADMMVIGGEWRF